MGKFLGCMFGYILLGSFVIGTVVKSDPPKWVVIVAFALFLIGWVFVMGFAADESGTIKKSLLAAREFLKEWLLFIAILFGAGFVLFILDAGLRYGGR